MPKLPFMRLVKELMADAGWFGAGLRIQRQALLALQEMAEAFLVNEFESKTPLISETFMTIVNDFRYKPSRYPREACHYPDQGLGPAETHSP